MFDYGWFQNLDDNDIFYYDPYDYYDNGITYNWFQTVIYDFSDNKWSFLAMLPFDECANCDDFLPITSVTFIGKSGKMYIPICNFKQTSKNFKNFLFRYLLAAANKRENDENSLKYYSMDFSDFKNQWIEHQTNIPKFSGSPAFEFNNEKKFIHHDSNFILQESWAFSKEIYCI